VDLILSSERLQHRVPQEIEAEVDHRFLHPDEERQVREEIRMAASINRSRLKLEAEPVPSRSC
jgi:acetylornithine deacetylase/succinyl-diaminopimelate desuccinylase-like protein